MPYGFESHPRHHMLHSLWYRIIAKLFPTPPLVTVGISRDALIHNFDTYAKAYPQLLLAPVLKSNAYGHDLGLVARVLDHKPVAFFMVDSLYEARKLRSAGIRSRILVMGYTRPESIARARLPRLDFSITDIQQLRDVLPLLRVPTRLHLKLDTGMHRQGIMERDLPEAIGLLSAHPFAQVVGVCSHFADADTENSTHAQSQVTTWKSMCAVVQEAFPSVEFVHLAATKGARYAKEAGTNVLRVGIGLYGFDTAPLHSTPLTAVLELRSIIAGLRTVPRGESVGYNATFTTEQETHIATIPAGYYEGVDRRLSNKGRVLIHGKECPIIGRVSMNMISVDVTGVAGVAIGDVVTLISRSISSSCSIPSIASAVSTSEYLESIYVLLAHIPQHLKRVLE